MKLPLGLILPLVMLVSCANTPVKRDIPRYLSIDMICKMMGTDGTNLANMMTGENGSDVVAIYVYTRMKQNSDELVLMPGVYKILSMLDIFKNHTSITNRQDFAPSFGVSARRMCTYEQAKGWVKSIPNIPIILAPIDTQT